MKTITLYQCEICGSKYEDEQSAKDCEAKGVFNPSAYRQGLMYEYYHDGFIGIFALPTEPEISTRDKHYGEIAFWACRAPEYNGDSIYHLCGFDGFLQSDEKSVWHFKKHHYIDRHLNGPEFKRMVAHLKSQGITPSYYTKAGELVIME